MPQDNSSLLAMNDDLASNYITGREFVREKAAADELLQRFSKRPNPTDEGKAAPPEPPAPGEKETGGAGAALADIAGGIVEAPRAIAHGIIDAVNETIDLTKSFDDFMSEKFGTVVLGEDGVTVVSPDEAKAGKKASGIPDIPNFKEPETTTGGVVEGISQFLAGFLGAGKIKALQSIKPATTAGKFGKASVQGAVADFTAFDPHEERLANLIQEYPDLQNPVTEFLQADPTDSEAEGRFKNTIEGFGLGTMAEGFFKSVKMLRQAAITKRTQSDLERIPGGNDDARPKIEDNAFDDLGDVEQPVVAERPPKQAPDADLGVPDDVAAKGIDQPTDAETYINFARIDSPEDVQNVMQQMADAFKGDVDSARRGEKRTFAQMELDAEHVNAWDTLMARRQGEALNAEQSVAARQLWATSADKLSQLAKKAASTGSEADLFAFRKMMATHQTIQNEVIAARTETARALASWRIPVGSGAERFMEIDNALMQSGGKEMSRDMAQRIAALADAGMIHEMDKFVEKGAWAKGRDAMLEAWVNALLSGPKTHLVNAMSNTSVIFQQMYERKTAAKIAQLLGDENSVQLGEAMAQYSGMVSGFRDAVRYAAKSFRTGETGFGLNKLELPQQNAISSEALGMSSTGFVGRSVDVLGTAVNVPGRALGAADEFFKTIGYRMELNALALRKATQEANAGLIEPDQLKARMADLLENPPEEVRLAAIDQATYQTFTNTPGKLAQLIQEAKGNYPGLNIILPFVRTPANIMTYTFERTPLAPLFQHFRADIAAGGARRDLALAKMSTGTSIMLVAADMAMNGEITGQGPSNTSERNALYRTGWQPYSIKMGDRYYAYNRMDPIGTTLGLGADMVEILANDDYGPEKEKAMEEVGIAVAMSIANNAMSKTYLSGLSDLMQAMADPERYGESFFQRLSGSVVPTGVAEVTRGLDPYMRETQSMLDAIRRRTPGLSDGLPPRRNLWGEPISYQSGLGVMYDAFSPIYSKSQKPSPIDEAILENEMTITMPPKKTSIDGARVNLEMYPGAYSRYLQLAGNEMKHPAWGMGAKDLLNEIVSGKHVMSPIYEMKSDGPDGGKALYVQSILQQYRELAKDQLLKEFPEMKDAVQEQQRHKQQLRMPRFN